MRTARLAALAVFAAFALAPAAHAREAQQASQNAVTPAPKNLRGFLLRADEPRATTFSRTPSFAWDPVRGALRYEFELSTSKSFGEGSIIWSNVKEETELENPSAPAPTAPAPGTTPTAPAAPATATPAAKDRNEFRAPAAAVDIALPWTTGNPSALYAHVRAVTARGATRWSKIFAFDMRWTSIAQQLAAPAGLVRWSPVDGATGYQVWFREAGHVFSTNTTVADQREYYLFHQAASWSGTVTWRVRATREVKSALPNKLPAVSHGPWSPWYVSYNPPFAVGNLATGNTISDVEGTPATPVAHQLMPALTWSGNTGEWFGPQELYRVLVYTDRDCVNLVYVGAITGGPAYAPRTTGTLKLPASASELAAARTKYLNEEGNEGATFLRGGFAVESNETLVATPEGEGKDSGSGSGAGSTAGVLTQVRAVELWELDFPTSRYYWTVVPVAITFKDSSIEYRDTDVGQDACQAGRVGSFGKESQPVVVSSGAPYVSGLSPAGRLIAASRKRPQVYGTPLVAWQPAVGAQAYEVQWSRRAYPWKRAGTTITYGTSAVLDLTPGTWYYRVRGLNLTLPKKPQMSWSQPAALVVAKPKFQLVKK